MSKVILIDGSVLSFRSILNWAQLIRKKNEGKIAKSQFILPSHYTYFSMIISVLKKVGVNKDDILILALDGRNSWRRAFFPEYKAQRKGERDKAEEVDWAEHWKKIDEINVKLHKYSHINVLRMDSVFNYEDLINSEEGMKFINPDLNKFSEEYGIEGDDIISQACHFYKDKECIVITIDKDLYQLDYLDNVKIFSMNLRTPKGKNGAYVLDCDPLKIISDKCRLGDKSDNIIVDKNFPEKDAELRRFIIDVLNPISFLAEPIESILSTLKPKENVIQRLPFYKEGKKSLASRFNEIYTDKNLVTWDYCVKLAEKKKKKKEKVKA